LLKSLSEKVAFLAFFTDSLPGLALTAEPVERNAMNRPPRPKDEGIFAHGRGFFMVLTLALSAVVFVAIEMMVKLRVKSRLHLHLAF